MKHEPLWKGPESDHALGGVTQSLIGATLICSERARLKLIEGLAPPKEFNYKIEYGNMFHVCEEHTAAKKDWEKPLLTYARNLVDQWGNDLSAEINKWYNVCKVQYPIYLKNWKGHEDEKLRKPLYQEEVFKIPYKLPSGRTVYLRGKFDSVDTIGKEIWIKENKAKGTVNKEKLLAELFLDLQSMTYSTAMVEDMKQKGYDKKFKFGGVRYNVIKRPLSQGEFCIKQKKGRGKANVGAETEKQFYDRLRTVIKDNTKYFFHRMKIGISQEDLGVFQGRCLNPILENLCDDYEWWSWCKILAKEVYALDKGVYDYKTREEVFPQHRRRHFLFPHGLFHTTLEGFTSPYDEYLQTGNKRNLVRIDNLFEELQ